MLQYLFALRNYVKPLSALILDTYAAHSTIMVRSYDAYFGIEMPFIRPGTTNLCQPQDLRVFGALKALTKKPWRTIS